jgi:outer membrane protein OmpA-like peptidoglycan-associated protein
MLAVLFSTIGVFAQDAQLRTAVAGQKYKIEGNIVSKESDNTFIVRDATNVDTRIVVAPNASIKSKGFWGGDKYPVNSLVRGTIIEVEGRGDGAGSVAVSKVRFDKDSLETARVVDARATPIEERSTALEQNQERLSGQIDELMAISNAAKGGAKAAQDTADAAVAGVNATNKRISDMDDYVVQTTATVNFKVGSSVLSPDAKAQLDEVATAALTLRGYLIEVTGYASAEGSTKMNKALSERREKAVREYLIDTHNISLRRFAPSYGYGELQAVADNTTREGRQQNRRVEVKLLVNRGINTNVEVRPQPNE